MSDLRKRRGKGKAEALSAKATAKADPCDDEPASPGTERDINEGRSWMDWLNQVLARAPDAVGSRIRKVEADLDMSTNEEIEAKVRLLQETVAKRKERDAANTEGIRIELDHVQQQLESNDVNPLSLVHLGIYRSYLGRVSSSDENILSRVADLQKLVQKLLSAHPQRLEPQSGDTEDTHEAASILNVPVGRRRQMCAAFFLCFFTGLMLVFVSLGTLFYLIPVPFIVGYILYYIWVIFDMYIVPRPWAGEKARVSNAYKNGPVFKYFLEYFPIHVTVEKPKKLTPDGNYLMCLHPHGVQCASIFGILCNPVVERLLPGLHITAQTLPMNFLLPVMREHCIAIGAGNASRKCITQALTWRKGASTVLVVGGAKEALHAAPHTNKIALKDRMGFVKIALRTGASLVPMYSYGENSLYENLSADRPRLLAWQRRIQKLLTFAPLLVAGRGVFSYSGGLIPHRRPITLVIGEPVSFGKKENPTNEEVEAAHAKYIEVLRDLFNRYRNIYDPRCEDLILV
eukprot:TRINITY_DN23447_c1_g2_i1.p2 TRINITY_DN23447_c1_g2~~TRINITY_DN23447_c1_g2_i1.p2  ORF type:complete len:516 (+),score=228.06 TRINITY_DN23447_c1_g2_i1:60-1607(+)